MKAVMIFGTFDILHAGHLHLFHEARKFGDRLVAVVGRDQNVAGIKGQKPFHTETERLAILSHLDLIDDVVLGDKKDVYKVIQTVAPAVIALGYDQIAYVPGLEAAIRKLELNTKIVRLKPYRTGKYKTTKIKEYLARTI